MSKKIYSHLYFEDRVFANGVEIESPIKTNFLSEEKFDNDDELIDIVCDIDTRVKGGHLKHGDEVVYWPTLENKPMDAGVVSIYGTGGDGKSTFIRETASALNEKYGDIATVIKFGEPEADSLPNDPAILMKSLDKNLQKYKVIFIDSTKDLMLKWAGPLTSGGISKAPAGWINGLASSCARLNITLVLSINPLTKRAEAISELKELLISTSTTTILTESLRQGHISYVSRNSKGREEENVAVKFKGETPVGVSMLDKKFDGE